MQNKVLIKLIVPELDTNFDVFIPVNEVTWKIKKLILKSISDLTNTALNIDDEYILMNKDTCKIYYNNEVIINADIKNGSEMIFISRS